MNEATSTSAVETERKQDGPLISAVVASYNEEGHIGACLDGLLHQTGLPGELEIIVVDGGSTDRTLSIVQSYPGYGTRIRVLPNPKRFQVYAWNIGIREARGTYVALFSAHTEYSRDYLARCFEVRQRTGAANVGGVQVPVGEGVLGQAVAWAMQSPFGVGNAKFRYARTEQFVDTVFGAFFDKATLEELGGYDETIPFNEDSEFNYRLRKAGYTVFMSPAIRVRYHVRSSLRRLAQQMYRYGFWRRKTQLLHPDFVPLRVLAPPLMVLGCLASLLLFAVARSPFALLIPAAYGAFLLTAAAAAAFRCRSILTALAVPIALAVMHLAYGIGWWAGFFVHRGPAASPPIQDCGQPVNGPRMR